MFYIDRKTNKIKLTKGDNAELTVKVFDAEGKERAIFEDDTVVLTVRKTANSEAIAIEKTSHSDTIEFAPEDTKNLAVGTYVYDIQLTTFTGKIYTIVPMSYFEILMEVSQ